MSDSNNIGQIPVGGPLGHPFDLSGAGTIPALSIHHAEIGGASNITRAAAGSNAVAWGFICLRNHVCRGIKVFIDTGPANPNYRLGILRKSDSTFIASVDITTDLGGAKVYSGFFTQPVTLIGAQNQPVNGYNSSLYLATVYNLPDPGTSFTNYQMTAGNNPPWYNINGGQFGPYILSNSYYASPNNAPGGFVVVSGAPWNNIPVEPILDNVT